MTQNVYNQQNVKQYKGGLVKVNYEAENITMEITGIIRGNHKRFIIFDVNKTGYEIKINYSYIKSIKQIKSKNKKK
jgi:hypothetical protein